MGKLSRDKGAKYERHITGLLRRVFGESVRRGIGQERSGGEIADVDGMPRFWVQTKHGSPLNVSIRTAVAQAEAEIQTAKSAREVAIAAGRTDLGEFEEKWPLVLVRYNGERDLATMRLEHFTLLLAEWHFMRQALGFIPCPPSPTLSSSVPLRQGLAEWVAAKLEQFSKGDTDGKE